MQDARKNDEIRPDSGERATCQCIIAHPDKPKFLAMRHTTGFLPPQLKVPMDAILGPNVSRIVDGVKSKYGLSTTLLRQLARYRNYHCIELELQGSDGRRREAIWVGLDDYRRMRGGQVSPDDPLARWLEEQQQAPAQPLRPPWERRGWQRSVAHWVHEQLERLNIQATGALRQWRALSHTGTLLRIETSQGTVWCRAGYARPPLEASLSEFIASRWPGLTPEPLATETAENWMLTLDPRDGFAPPSDRPGLAVAARALGQLQAGSVDALEELQALGCETRGAEALREFVSGPALAESVPGPGETGLTDAEREQLARIGPVLAGLCDELADCGLPDLLVHGECYASQVFVGPDGARIIDWEDACIAPPAFALVSLTRGLHPELPADAAADPLVESWLQPLAGLGSAEQWRRALRLSARLHPSWELLRWSRELAWIEPGSVAEANARRRVTGLARKLLETGRGA